MYDFRAARDRIILLADTYRRLKYRGELTLEAHAWLRGMIREVSLEIRQAHEKTAAGQGSRFGQALNKFDTSILHQTSHAGKVAM